MSSSGVDYTGRPPDPQGLVAGGFQFVIAPLEDLTPIEAARFHGCGIGVGVIWDRVLFSGARDGTIAATRANRLGYGLERVIFANLDAAPDPVDYYSGFAAAVRSRGYNPGWYGPASLAPLDGYWWQQFETPASPQADIFHVADHHLVMTRPIPLWGKALIPTRT